ncbi:MAG: hypothetical protein RL711_1556 [Bacteroidota bacterium]|jgi:hypothetical protein
METLTKFLEKIPAVKSPIEAICYDDGSWWLKLKIDVHHKNSWHVVQELAHAINYLSEDEKLPTKFYPVSPAPFGNGGPEVFLSWIIENEESEFSPEDLKNWLEGRLPDVEDGLEQWGTNV